MVSDGMLSQDEIDALLKGDIDDAVNEVEAPLIIEDYLSLMEQDALGEIGNISFGSSATALSTLLNQKVDITTPTVSLIEKSKLSCRVSTSVCSDSSRIYRRIFWIKCACY